MPGPQGLADLARPLHRKMRISLSEEQLLVASTVTVGFAPVVQAGVASAGNGKAAPAEASPLGLFAALLDLLAAGTTKAPEDATVPSPVQFTVPEAKVSTQTMLSGLMAGVDPETISTDGAMELPAVTTDSSLTALLQSFVDGLSALQGAVENETPIDPQLEAKLVETLDALAVALGLPLPAPPAVDPAITAAAAVDSAAAEAIDPLAIIAPSVDTPVMGDPAEAPLPSAPQPSTAAAPALGAITSTPVDAPQATAAPATGAPELAVDDPAGQTAPKTTLPPEVADLAERLQKLAEAIEARVPGLAKRLEAMAKRLQAGNIDPTLLAEFDIDADADVPQGEIARAIARLLAPGAELKPLPMPARFAAPTLALPIAIESAAEGKPADTRPEPPQGPAAPSPELGDATEPTDNNARAAEAQPKADPKPSANVPAPASITADAGPPQTLATSAPPTSVAAPVAMEAKAALAAYKPPPTQINIPQVAFEIVRQARAGNSRFEIRLDPPELGRIDVKLDVDSAGNVNARMTVERAETLDLMQRDRQVLERALAQAGLEGSKTNLEFSLRQNPFGREGLDFGGNGNGGNRGPLFGTGGDPEPAAADASTDTYRGLASSGGVNLFV
jgi:flagellar hook-length control protein FliK